VAAGLAATLEKEPYLHGSHQSKYAKASTSTSPLVTVPLSVWGPEDSEVFSYFNTLALQLPLELMVV
jgi:hypothetical protein